MSELRRGAVILDLRDGSIHGDLDHCEKNDLLESARALLSLLPQVQHRGLWGLGKDYDADCYIFTTNRRYEVPGELSLEIGWTPHRAFRLIVLKGDRASYWKGDWYSRPVGTIKDGQVVDSIEGIPDHHVPPAAPAVPTPRGKMRAGAPLSEVEPLRLF